MRANLRMTPPPHRLSSAFQSPLKIDAKKNPVTEMPALSHGRCGRVAFPAGSLGGGLDNCGILPPPKKSLCVCKRESTRVLRARRLGAERVKKTTPRTRGNSGLGEAQKENCVPAGSLGTGARTPCPASAGGRARPFRPLSLPPAPPFPPSAPPRTPVAKEETAAVLSWRCSTTARPPPSP